MPLSMKHLLLPTTAIASVLVLSLTGCSKGPAAGEDEEGPLSKYLSALYDTEGMTDEDYAAQQLRMEELTAECMQKEGFEYVPDVQDMGGGVSFDDSEDDDVPDWGSKEFAEQYGFGVINSPWNEELQGNEEVYVDPNQEYRDSLSDSEQTAYYEALHGPEPTEDQLDEEGSYTYDWTQAGCSGAADHEVSGGATGIEAAYEDPEFADLFAALDTVWNLEENDEIVALDGEWASCMADSGYPDFTNANDAQMSINDKLSALWGWDEAASDDAEPQEPSKADTEALAAEEIEIAVADVECKTTLKYDKKYGQIQRELEQSFVDDHRSELDAMLAKYAVSSNAKQQ